MEAADVDRIVREISLVDPATFNGDQGQPAQPDPDNDMTEAAMIQVIQDGDEAFTTAAQND
jgi:hypothetical protein